MNSYSTKHVGLELASFHANSCENWSSAEPPTTIIIGDVTKQERLRREPAPRNMLHALFSRQTLHAFIPKPCCRSCLAGAVVAVLHSVQDPGDTSTDQRRELRDAPLIKSVRPTGLCRSTGRRTTPSRHAVPDPGAAKPAGVDGTANDAVAARCAGPWRNSPGLLCPAERQHRRRNRWARK